jgi:hypothetical protein
MRKKMKKMLTILGAIGFMASTGSAVVSCGNGRTETKNITMTVLELTKDTPDGMPYNPFAIPQKFQDEKWLDINEEQDYSSSTIFLTEDAMENAIDEFNDFNENGDLPEPSTDGVLMTTPVAGTTYYYLISLVKNANQDEDDAGDLEKSIPFKGELKVEA